MSAWIIGGKFGGLAFRESKDHKFKDGSPFLPHVMTDKECVWKDNCKGTSGRST